MGKRDTNWVGDKKRKTNGVRGFDVKEGLISANLFSKRESSECQ